jgi:hypothetical protein
MTDVPEHGEAKDVEMSKIENSSTTELSNFDRNKIMLLVNALHFLQSTTDSSFPNAQPDIKVKSIFQAPTGHQLLQVP